MDIVTIDSLTKRYPGFTLDVASFSLSAGRIAGFIGRNGAGKTTTIKSMLNLVHQLDAHLLRLGERAALRRVLLALCQRRVVVAQAPAARRRLHRAVTEDDRAGRLVDEDRRGLAARLLHAREHLERLGASRKSLPDVFPRHARMELRALFEALLQSFDHRRSLHSLPACTPPRAPSVSANTFCMSLPARSWLSDSR